MVYDLTMLKTFYAAYSEKIERVRNVLQRPMTLAEKILYAHLYDGDKVKNYRRGEDYVNFRPDRVAMQDATAQMALLQFMNAGREQVAVPSTVHCDHLIQAYKGAKEDIATATKTNEEVYNFLRDVSSRYGIGFWQPGAECLGIAFGNKTFVTNGIANLDIIPIIVMIWTISIFVIVVIKKIIDKKAVEE